MIHLDQKRLDAVLDGSLSADEARRLQQHLLTPCTRCEAFLDEADLDILTLASLLVAQETLANPPSDGLSRAEKQATWDAIAAAAPVSVPSVLPKRRGALLVFGTLAAMAAAVLVMLSLPPDPYDGLKGDTPPTPQVQLKILAGRDHDGGLVDLQRLGDNDQVSARQALIFELDADQPAARYLFAVEADGQVTPLFPPSGSDAKVEPPGSRPVNQGSSWVVLDLADMVGPLTVVGAASATPLAMDAGIVQPWERHKGPPGVDYDSLTLRLVP